MRCLPSALEPGQERLLFRLESDTELPGPCLLLQTWQPPDWSWLSEPGAQGYLLPGVADNPASKPFRPALHVGQMLAFRLRANPTAKRSFGPDKKRVGLYDEAAQIEWLRRKGRDSGFELVAVRTRQEGMTRSYLPRKQSVGRDIGTWLAVTFDGLLRVADPDALLCAVAHGIGSAKGLGFGLLSLAPAPSG
jgi:CRISPR system Cascade subunit CasE